MAQIAWIGAGKMGLPVCKRLKAAGHDVRVLARTAERREEFVALGFGSSLDVTTLINAADIIFTCVSDDAALADVVMNDAFKATLPKHAIFIDMSTVSPEVSVKIANYLPKSFAYLRSPVSGSTAMAEAGTLTALVSGPKSAFDACAPILATYTKKAFYLGEAEEARYLKLAINSMVCATSVLLGEALAFGLKGGLTHASMLEVITQSAVASPLIGYKKDMIISGDYRPAATLDMLKKDLDLLLSTAADMNAPLPVNSMIRDIYAQATERGLGGKDFFVLVDEAEKIAGVVTTK
jgi:3-hydroxyisobutyrate dehydrogenase-like beta-hydroxyacid dehydrogenase